MNNVRKRKKLTLRRISDETSDKQQGGDISTIQENLIEQRSNLFTITDIRSLSEENCDDDDLIPTDQELDGSSSASCDTFDYNSLLANQFENPFFPHLYAENNVKQSNEPNVMFYNLMNLTAAANTVNDDNSSEPFTETVRKSESADDANIANNNTSAAIKQEAKTLSPEKYPVVVLNDVSTLLRSNKISEQNNVEPCDNTNDEFISFEERLTNQLKQMPLKNALIMQSEIQDIIILERLKCLEKQ